MFFSKPFQSFFTFLFSFLLILFFAFLISCSSRQFPIIDTTASTGKMKVPDEDLGKYRQAMEVVNLGSREFQNTNYPKANELAEKSIVIYPTADGYYLSGISKLKLANGVGAIRDLKAANSLDPDNDEILLQLGLAYSTQGEGEKSLQVYSDLVSKRPDEPIYKYRKAIQEKSLQRYDDALASLKSIDPKHFSNRAELYTQLADVSVKLKDYPEAERYMSLAEKENPESKSLKSVSNSVKTSSFLESGNRYLQEKNYSQAIQSYEKAVSSDPKNPSPLVFLGIAHFLNQDFRKSEQVLDQALRLQDEFIPAFEAYSALYLKEKRYKDSLRWAQNGLKLNPKAESLWNRQGLAQWRLGDVKGASLSFRRATEIAPMYKEADENLGFLLMEERRFSEAKNIFQSLKKRFPDSNEYSKTLILCDQLAFISSGDTYLGQGRILPAKKDFEKAKQLNPEDPTAWAALGRAHFLANEYKDSERNFKKALALEEDHIPSLQGLVRLYAKTGDRSQERQYSARLEKRTAGDPTYGLLLARILEDEGKFPEAESRYQSLKKKFPEEGSVSLRFGLFYYNWAVEKNAEEKYPEALALLKKAEKENPNIPELKETERIIRENQKFDSVIPWIRSANSLYDRKKYSEAMGLYQKAFDESKKPNLLVKVAECYVGMGQEEKALNLLESAASKEKQGNTDFKEAIYSFFLQKGEVAKAEKGFYKILQDNPGSYYSYYKLGLIELGRNNYEKSIALLDKSLILNYQFPAGNVAKGVVYSRMNRQDLAKEEFERARGKDQGLDIASYNIGVLFFNQDMDREARKVFQEILKTNPDFAESYYQLSFLDFKSGDISGAEKNIKKALEIERSPANLFAYARILERKRDFANWKEVAREMSENFPSSPYTAKLRSLAFQDEPIYFQPVPVLGQIKSPPFQIGNLLVINYGTSLVSSQLGTQSRLWRIPLKGSYTHFAFQHHLFGLSKEGITRWNLNTGEELSRIPLDLPKNQTPVFFGFYSELGLLHAYTNAGNTVIDLRGLDLVPLASLEIRGIWSLKITSDSKVLAWRQTDSGWEYFFIEKDIFASLPKVAVSSNPNQLLRSGVKDPAKEFSGFQSIRLGSKNSGKTDVWMVKDKVRFINQTGFWSNGKFYNWKEPIQDWEIVGEDIILKRKDSFALFQDGKSEQSLDFTKEGAGLAKVDSGFLVWESDGKLAYFDGTGQKKGEATLPGEFRKSAKALTGVTVQELKRSK
jgi:tetratricopeptide (TPR) repeat protein